MTKKDCSKISAYFNMGNLESSTCHQVQQKMIVAVQ